MFRTLSFLVWALAIPVPAVELEQPLEVRTPGLRALAHAARALVAVAADVRVETDPDGDALAVADVNGTLTELKTERAQAAPALRGSLEAMTVFAQSLQRTQPPGTAALTRLAALLQPLSATAPTDFPFQYDLGEAWVALHRATADAALQTQARAAVDTLVRRFPKQGRVYGLQARLEAEKPAPLQTQLTLFKRCADLDARARRCLEGYLIVADLYEVPRCLHEAVAPGLQVFAVRGNTPDATPLFSAADVESITLRREPRSHDSLELKLLPAAAPAFAKATASLAPHQDHVKLVLGGQEVLSARVSSTIADGRLALNPGGTPAARLLSQLCRVTEQRKVPDALQLSRGPASP